MDRRTVLTLVAMAISLFALTLDFTSINVAVATIEREFDSDLTGIQWVINAYTISLAMVIVTGGRLADMVGRRKVFFIGMVIFATASILAGAAPNDWFLITARTIQGIGAAILPAILGISYAAAPESKKSY